MSSRPSQSRCPRAAGASMSCEVSRIADADGNAAARLELPHVGQTLPKFTILSVRPLLTPKADAPAAQVSHCRRNVLESYGSDFWLTSALTA